MNIKEFRQQYPQYDDLSDDQLSRALHAEYYSDLPYDNFASAFGVSAGDTSILGYAKEMGKAVPRGFASSFLTAGEGLAELADAGTNAIGLEGLIDSGTENALVYAAKEGQKVLDSALGVDPLYQDKWGVKFSEGVGSFASFLVPGGAFKLAGYTGKAAPGAGRVAQFAKEVAPVAPLAVGVGAGEQAQRIEQARERGIQVSQGQEDAAILAGGVIGVSELLPVERLLRRIPGNVPDELKDGILAKLKSAAVSGTIEGVQETVAGISQDLIEKGIYNEDIEVGDSLFDDFTVGAGVGALADLVVNYASGRRNRLSDEAAREREAQLRQAEERDRVKFLTALNAKAMEAENNAAIVRQLDEAIAAEEDPDVKAGLIEERAIYAYFAENGKPKTPPAEPSVIPPPQEPIEDVVEFGRRYAANISDTLGDAFPSTGKFTIQQSSVVDTNAGPVDTTSIEAQLTSEQLRNARPAFSVVDSDGNRYGVPLDRPDQANALAGALNEEVFNTGIRGEIENILDNAEQAYTPEVADTLFTYGWRVLNPTNSGFSFIDVNRAAGTTADKGYLEGLSFRDIEAGTKKRDGSVDIELPDGRVVNTTGLTVGQKINKKRVENGLPETQVFTVQEVRDELGEGFEGLQISGVQPAPGDSKAQIKRLLEEKNIVTDLAAPEFETLVRSFTGRSKFKDLTKGEANVLYQRLSALPRFDEKTKLPDFTPKPYTRTQFKQASRLIQDANTRGQKVSDQELAAELGIDPKDPRRQERLSALKKDLARQGVESKPILALPAPTGDSINDLRAALEQELRGFGLEGIGLNLNQTLLLPDGAAAQQGTEGFYSPFQRLIFLAVDRVDPKGELTPEQRISALAEIMNHEVVHAARELDLWTQQEWSNLENAAARLIKPGTNKTYLQVAKESYPDYNPAMVVEEAVAELAREYSKNRKAVTGRPQSLLNRLFKLFEKLKSAIKGTGFQTYEEVLESFQRGDIGRRARGEVRTLRASEAASSAVPERLRPLMGTTPRATQRPQARPTTETPRPTTETPRPTADFDVSRLGEAAVVESRGINIEVAPDPRDVAAVDTFNAFPEITRAEITTEVAEPVIRDAMRNLGITDYEVEYTLGGFQGGTQPSIIVRFGDRVPYNKMLEASKVLGTLWKQQAVIVYDENDTAGGTQTQFVKVNPSRQLSYEETSDLFKRVYDRYPVAAGFTSREGSLVFGNFTDTPQQEFNDNISSVLNDIFGDLDYSADASSGVFRSDWIEPVNLEGTKYGQVSGLPGVEAGREDIGRQREFDSLQAQSDELFREAVRSRSDAASEEALDAAIRESRRVPRSTVSIFEMSDDLAKKELGLKPGKNLTRLVGEALNKETISRFGKIEDKDTSDQAARKISDAMANEVLHQLQTTSETGTGIGWYSKNYPRALDLLSKRFPELITDKGARSLFTAIVAVTSNGENVKKNISNAIDIYSKARSGRRLSSLYVSTRRTDSLKDNLLVLDSLVEKYGMDGFSSVLLEEMTVGEINAELRSQGEEPESDYTANTIMPRSALYFGPKLGAFYANLMGSEGYLTMDLWWSRTFNRMRGTLIPKPTKQSIETIRDMLIQENKLPARWLSGVVQPTDEDIINAAVPYWESAKKKKYKNTTKIEKSANTLIKNARLNLEEAPFRASDRSFMIKTARIAQEKLRKKGINLSLADIQAALWYYEKRLYAKLTGQGTDDIGYEEAIISASEDARPERSAPRFYRGSPSGTITKGTGRKDRQTVPTKPPVVRESRNPALLEQAREKAVKEAEQVPVGAVPYLNANASPEALYVAQNPVAGEPLTPDMRLRYSRSNQPDYDQEDQRLIEKMTGTDQPPNKTPGETYIESLNPSEAFRFKLDKFRQEAIFNYSRLEYLTKTDPRLIGNLADVSSLAAAEMADRGKAILAEVLTRGVPVYEGGITKVKDFVFRGKQYKGLIDIMAPIFNTQYGNLEKAAQSYAIAKRSQRLIAEGKKAPGDAMDVQAAEAMADKYINPETNESYIREWYDAWQAFNENTITYLRDTGMLDNETAELWRNQSDYVPFYRVQKDGTVDANPKVFGGLTSTTQLKMVGKSSEAITAPLLDSIVSNLDAAIAMGMKNVAQQRIVRDMVNIGLGKMIQRGESTEGKMVVTFKVQGKKYQAEIIDPLIFESMQAMPNMSLTGIMETVATAPAQLLREMIIRDPAYMLANSLRDTVSAFVTTGSNFIPFVDSMKGMVNGLDVLSQYGIASGIDFSRDPDKVVEYMAEEAAKRGMRLPGEYTGRLSKLKQSSYMKPMVAIWNGLGKVSARAEAATRKAVYDDVLARTGNEAEAAYQALSVINYGRRGRNPHLQALTAMVPFMNARIQGLDIIIGRAPSGRYSARSEKTRRQNIVMFTARALTMVGLTALYYSMVSDDEEYQSQTEETKDNYYIFPITKGDLAKGERGFAVKVPIPFEVGVLFKLIPERILRAMNEDSDQRALKQSLLGAAGNTLTMNPIPQAIRPLMEIAFNRDFFTGNPIVPSYMEMRMEPGYRSKFGTNQIAVMLGEKTNISPLKIDHLMNGYTGTLGMYTLQVIDELIREGSTEYPARRPTEYPFVRRFFADNYGKGLQDQFYDMSDKILEATGSINQLIKDGRIDELQAHMTRKGSLIAMKDANQSIRNMMQDYRQQRNMILKSDMDEDAKRQMIDELDRHIALSLRIVPELRQRAFGPDKD